MALQEAKDPLRNSKETPSLNRRSFLRSSAIVGLFALLERLFSKRLLAQEEPTPEPPINRPPLIFPEQGIDYAHYPIDDEIHQRVLENSGISDEINNLTQKRDALELMLQLHSEGLLSPEKIAIGWVEVSALNIGHPAFTGLEMEVDSVDTGDLHGTSALWFATQLERGEEAEQGGEAGLSQKEWTKIHFKNLYEAGHNGIEENMKMYAQQIIDLVNSGVGVIGSMPTWRDSELSQGNHYSKNPGIVAIRRAYAYAQSKNVFIVIPAGNANTDLSTDADHRVLHELAKVAVPEQSDNLIVMGGITLDLERATWYGDSGPEGSNYGAGYINFVTVIERQVPSFENQYSQYPGTTFAVGEMVSLIQAVQSILGRDEHGNLPALEVVHECINSTARNLGTSVEFGKGVAQMKQALVKALEIVNFRRNQ